MTTKKSRGADTLTAPQPRKDSFMVTSNVTTTTPKAGTPRWYQARIAALEERILSYQVMGDLLKGSMEERDSQITDLRICNDYKAAEVLRIAEDNRLVEQGRDEALRGRMAGLDKIKSLHDELTTSQRVSAGYKANLESATKELAGVVKECDRLRAELDHVNADLIQERCLQFDAEQDNAKYVKALAFEGTLQTIVASVLVALAAFFVGRWAR